MSRRAGAPPREAAPAPAGDALLIVDMISAWDFPGGAALRRHALPAAPRMATLAARCRRLGVPVIYANDNHGDWRSDFRHVVERALAAGGAGATITRQLLPHASDYFVLKPKHSAFHATPLQLLLQHLGVRRLIVSGVASDQCVLHTVADARMREIECVVPADTCATRDADRQRRLLEHLQQVMRVGTPPSRSVRLCAPAGPGGVSSVTARRPGAASS